MIKKIIIILPYRGIGDLLFHIPFFKGINLKFKNKLIIFTNSANKAKSILKNEKYIKRIEYLNFKREGQFSNSIDLLKRINREKPDLCILTAPTKRLIIPLLLSKSKEKVFFKKEEMRDLSKYITKQSKVSFPKIKFNKDFSLNYAQQKGMGKIFISIDSHHDTNNWKEIYYIDLIKKLVNLSKIRKIYINFAPSKKNNFNRIIKTFVKSRKISFTYNKKFNDIIKIINNCQYVMGNESGPICIAASLRKKIYSIYFPKYTNKSSKTIYDKVKFFNTDIVNPKKIVSRIYNDLI